MDNMSKTLRVVSEKVFNLFNKNRKENRKKKSNEITPRSLHQEDNNNWFT